MRLFFLEKSLMKQEKPISEAQDLFVLGFVSALVITVNDLFPEGAIDICQLLYMCVCLLCVFND